MERLLKQLEAIEAIVDTVSPAQIERDPEGVADRYQLYARSYDPIEPVKVLKDRAIAELGKGKPVNGYLSADYGYGKTATTIYLWSEFQRNGILAVPPFKFKELGDLMVASYSWMKASLESADRSEGASKLESLYKEYSLQSQEEEAAEIARKYNLSEGKALKIVMALKAETSNTDSILNFWRESVPILGEAGFKGLAVFADESQEFLRAEEGSSVRIQTLSDLVKGMRALGKTPVALILSMPVSPTEAAIEEQAGDIIHRMKEQKISLRLTDAYKADFPGKLWDSLCDKFLDDLSQKTRLVHPATIESLGQLCDRKDLTNGPRTIVEVFKRAVRFARNSDRAYSPLDLIEDYLTETIQLYGSGQRRIKNAIDSVKPSISFPEHPKGQEVVKLLASFPAGVSEAVAEELGLLGDLRKLAADDNLYGLHIIQLTSDRFALVALSRPSSPTVMDRILNKFRQGWFGDNSKSQKQERALTIFRQEIIPLLLPSSRAGRGFWSWRGSDWKQDRYGFYNFAVGAPERYNAEFPNRSLVVSAGTEGDGLMKFTPPEETHLDWRFYCGYDLGAARDRKQKITAIAGTGQVDFHLQLDRSFQPDYPPSFGLLKKAIPPEQCSACMLLDLSYYMKNWLQENSDISLGDRQQIERHRQDCHQYAIQLLFPPIKADAWDIEGIAGVSGAGTKLLESVFERKCKALFPEYRSFYHNLRPSLLKYKSALELVAIAFRRSSQLYRVPKAELERLLATAGSGLPSLLAIFHKHSLVGEYKIASNKEEHSQLKFTQHPLESFIQQQLQASARTEIVPSGRSQEEVKVLDYLDLQAAVQRLGYLTEELDEALAWLQLRRYVEWEKQRGIVRQAVASPDFEDLLGRLSELSDRVAALREVFDEAMLDKLAQNIDEERATIVSVASPLGQGNVNQLTLFETPVGNSEEQQSLSEIALDRVQRSLQALGDRLSDFRREKREAFQKELGEIKLASENLTADLNASKVGELISGSSGLEPCLNDNRKQLERQIERLNKDCHNLARAIAVQLEEADILALHDYLESSRQSWQICASTKKELQPLAAGLEQWRITVARASALRENLADNPELLRAYDDEFVDRVVTYFSTHQIEGLTKRDLLVSPLEELEERLKSNERSGREAFEERLNSYQALLNSLAPDEYNLKTRCRYDREDRPGSYATLKQAFLEKVLEWCDRQTAEWEALERDLFFLAEQRDLDVTEFSNRVTRAKDDLDNLKAELPGRTEDMEALKEAIAQLQALAKLLAETREQYLQLDLEQDENLAVEERELLAAIDSFFNGVTISQLRQQMQQIKSGTAPSSPTERRDIWELVKVLHQKGYLEISLSRRNF